MLKPAADFDTKPQGTQVHVMTARERRGGIYESNRQRVMTLTFKDAMEAARWDELADDEVGKRLGVLMSADDPWAEISRLRELVGDMQEVVDAAIEYLDDEEGGHRVLTNAVANYLEGPE